MFQKNKIEILLFSGIIFVFFAPVILSRDWGLIQIEHYHNIGDAIGGMTAPVTSLIGSILVYYALKAQVDANKKIADQVSEQRSANLILQDQIKVQENQNHIEKRTSYVMNLLSFAFKSIDDFFYSDEWAGSNVIERTGRDAFTARLKYYHKPHAYHSDFETDPKNKDVMAVLEVWDRLCTLIKIESIPDADKKTLGDLVGLYYSMIISVYLNDAKDQECAHCRKIHNPIPDPILKTVSKTLLTIGSLRQG